MLWMPRSLLMETGQKNFIKNTRCEKKNDWIKRIVFLVVLNMSNMPHYEWKQGKKSTKQ